MARPIPLAVAQRETSSGARSVAACMTADLAVNPFATTEAEEKTHCYRFFDAFMNRTVTPNCLGTRPRWLLVS